MGTTITHPPDDDESARGATLVEFALILPIFIAVIFGAIDFGWAYSQNLDVRSAAREGARYAVVNGASGASSDARGSQLLTDIQSRVTQLDKTKVQVAVTLEDSNANGTTGDAGDNVVVCLRYPISSLSGVMSVFLNGNYFDAKAVMRMEQDANFRFAGSTSGTTTSPAWNGGTCAS